jgi:proliferating cell nuclear antigen
MLEKELIRLTHPSAKAFITVFQVLGSIVDETLIKFTSDGLSIRALDPAKVALIEIDIPSSAFLEYYIDRELSIGMNLSALLKVMSKPKKTDKLVFKGSEDFYELTIEGAVIKRYKFRSIEVAASELPELSLDFSVKALMLAQAFKSTIKDLKGVGSITFLVEDEENLYIRAADGGAEAKLSKMGGSILELEVKEPSKSTYDEDYLSRVLDLAGITENMELQFGSDMPAKLSFNLADGSAVRYLLAPKA